MAVDSESSYRYLGTGEPLALEVSGPTVEACLARAVEGFTAALADVHPSVVPVRYPFDVAGVDPTALLLAVLEEAISLTRRGELAVSADSVVVAGGRASGSLEAVPARWTAPTVTLPVAVKWHDLSLEQRDGHWVGRAVLGVVSGHDDR